MKTPLNIYFLIKLHRFSFEMVKLSILERFDKAGEKSRVVYPLERKITVALKFQFWLHKLPEKGF